MVAYAPVMQAARPCETNGGRCINGIARRGDGRGKATDMAQRRAAGKKLATHLTKLSSSTTFGVLRNSRVEPLGPKSG